MSQKQHKINVGPADGFPIEAMRIVTAGRREVGVIRRADGRVQAVRNWCPHKGAEVCKGPVCGTMLPGAPGTLTFAMDGEILRCPWHGYEFEIATGKRPFVGGSMRLRVYPACIEGGDIWIDMRPQGAAGEGS